MKRDDLKERDYYYIDRGMTVAKARFIEVERGDYSYEDLFSFKLKDDWEWAFVHELKNVYHEADRAEAYAACEKRLTDALEKLKQEMGQADKWPKKDRKRFR